MKEFGGLIQRRPTSDHFYSFVSKGLKFIEVGRKSRTPDNKTVRELTVDESMTYRYIK